MDIIEKIKRDLSSADANIRRKAINGVSYKPGSSIVLKILDKGIIPILKKALSDSDREVQRAAARALRPWVQFALFNNRSLFAFTSRRIKHL